jgi:sugar phosphate isomerase/epimerase
VGALTIRSLDESDDAMLARYSCADFTFPLLDHERVLALIALLDLQGVDIGLFEGRSHLWPSREFAQLPESARRLRRQLDAHGLQAADIFLQLDPDFVPYAVNQPDAARRQHARDQFVRALEYASLVGAGHVTALPGVLFDGEPESASWARAVDELAWRVEQARAAGVLFGVEPHVGSIAPSPARAAALVAEVPGLTLTLDYTHFVRLGVPDAEIEPLVPLASHFHVRGAHKGRLQASFARSTIDYARVLRAMAACGYAGWLGIEYVWQDWEGCNECDNVAETIQFRDFLRAEVARLA